MILICSTCSTEFFKNDRQYKYALKKNQTRFFCGFACSGASVKNRNRVTDEHKIARRKRENEKLKAKRALAKLERQKKHKEIIIGFIGTPETILPIGLMA